MLKKAVTHCPRAEMLWLMAAKEKWLSEDVAGARTILKEAFLANPDSEQARYWIFIIAMETQPSSGVKTTGAGSGGGHFLCVFFSCHDAA